MERHDPTTRRTTHRPSRKRRPHLAAIAGTLLLLATLALPVAAQGDRGPLRQEAKLTEPPWQGEGHHGFTVDISGDTAAVGAPRDTQPGSVFVYVRDGVAWEKQANLTDPDGDGRGSFGAVAAVDGDTLAVGAYSETTAQGPGAGEVHVYRRQAGAWHLETTLVPDDPAEGGRFGFALDLAGDTLVATALGDADGTGAAYVFTRSQAGWRQTAKLAADVPRSALLGSSVALADGTVAVGAPAADTDRGEDRGAVYVFERVGRSWDRPVRLTAPDGRADDGYGHAVAIDGPVLAVGAPQVDTDVASDAGAAYVHRQDADGWSPERRFTASDAGRLDKLGFSVAVHDGVVVAGAPNHDAEEPDAGPLCVEQNPDNVVVGFCGNNGALYVLDADAGDDALVGKVTGSDKLGWSAALDGSTLIGGAYLDDEEGLDAGAAFVYGFDGDGDGLTDGQESAAGTDPDDPDTDGDRLTDRDEVHETRTHPLASDTDRDGTPDGREDPDGDGLGHAAELHPYGADPFDPDTDGDGFGDGTEAARGSDPVNPASVPTPAGPVTATNETRGTEVPLVDHLPPAA